MVALTPDIVATGSEDGMIRVIQVLPHKFRTSIVHIARLWLSCIVGVIATHDEYPIERMELDRRKKWLGSVSHDECIKLTDVEDMFEDSDEERENEEVDAVEEPGDGDGDVDMADSDDEVPTKQRNKKKGKAGMGDLTTTKRDKDDTFFDDL